MTIDGRTLSHETLETICLMGVRRVQEGEILSLGAGLVAPLEDKPLGRAGFSYILLPVPAFVLHPFQDGRRACGSLRFFAVTGCQYSRREPIRKDARRLPPRTAHHAMAPRRNWARMAVNPTNRA